MHAQHRYSQRPFTMRFVLAGALLIAALCGPTASAQDAANVSEAPGLPPGLEGIPGVEAGMTSGELIELALNFAAAQRLDDAQKVLYLLSQQNPNDVRALNSLGYVYELQASAARSDRTDPDAKRKADTYIRAAIEIYLRAAPMAFEAGNLRTASKMYNAVLLHDPGNPPALLGLARVMVQTDQKVQAVERYKSYINTLDGESDSRAYLELGQIYAGLRYRNLAISALEKARELNPESAEVLVALAEIHQESGDVQQALKLAESAVERNPSNPAYRSLHAATLFGRARPALQQMAAGDANVQAWLDEARTEARRSVELAREQLEADPGNPELLTALGGYYEVYRRIMNAMLSTDQANLAIRIDLARIIQRHGAVQQALSLHQALTVLKGAGPAVQNIPLLERRAEIEFELYLRDEARQTCRQLVALEADNRVARRILEAVGDQGPGPASAPGP